MGARYWMGLVFGTAAVIAVGGAPNMTVSWPEVCVRKGALPGVHPKPAKSTFSARMDAWKVMILVWVWLGSTVGGQAARQGGDIATATLGGFDR
jgi:hypothetical protein